MSEIKRYDNENGGSIACHECYMDESDDGDYVRHADHVVYLNEVKLDRDALRGELAALREELATVRRGKENADLALATQTKNKDQYKRRAMAAEQRNATLETELRNIRQSCELSRLRDSRIDELLTKPTESGASE